MCVGGGGCGMAGLGKMASRRQVLGREPPAGAWGRQLPLPTSICWLREMNLKINLINFLG